MFEGILVLNVITLLGVLQIQDGEPASPLRHKMAPALANIICGSAYLPRASARKVLVDRPKTAMPHSADILMLRDGSQLEMAPRKNRSTWSPIEIALTTIATGITTTIPAMMSTITRNNGQTSRRARL